MNWSLIMLIPLTSCLVSLGVLWFVVRHRQGSWWPPLALMLGSAAIWSLGYTFELGATDILAKVFWDNVQFLGSSLVVPGALVFVRQYSGKDVMRRPIILGLLAIEPVLTNVLAWTNPLHGLIRSNPELIGGGPLRFLAYDWGPWLYVSSIYGMVLLLMAIATLILQWSNTPPARRSAPAILLTGLLIPLAGVLVTIFDLVELPIRQLDLSPLTIAIGSSLMAWGALRHQLFVHQPLTYRGILDHISEGVVVLDESGHILEANAFARRIATRQRLGQESFALAFPPAFVSAVDLSSKEPTIRETIMAQYGAARFYRLRTTPLGPVPGLAMTRAIQTAETGRAGTTGRQLGNGARPDFGGTHR